MSTDTQLPPSGGNLKSLTPSVERDTTTTPGPFERKESNEKAQTQAHTTTTTTPTEAATPSDPTPKPQRRLSKSMSNDVIMVASSKEQPHSKKVAFLAPEEDDILTRSMDSGRSFSGAFKVIKDTNAGLKQVTRAITMGQSECPD